MTLEFCDKSGNLQQDASKETSGVITTPNLVNGFEEFSTSGYNFCYVKLTNIPDYSWCGVNITNTVFILDRVTFVLHTMFINPPPTVSGQ